MIWSHKSKYVQTLSNVLILKMQFPLIRKKDFLYKKKKREKKEIDDISPLNRYFFYMNVFMQVKS